MDAITDRRVLAGDAYACDRPLAARQRLYDYQRPRFDLPAIVASHLTGVTGVVVDAGCGNGWYVRELRRRRPDLTVVGVDLSAGILANVPAPVLAADIAALPLADHSAAAVLAMHMLYHVPDIDAGLRELQRILVPDGPLIASTNAREDKIELDRLWSQAAADVLGTADDPRRLAVSSRFPLEDAPTMLGQHFPDLRVTELRSIVTVTDPEPVVAHLGSCRAWASDGTPFDATLDRARQRLTSAIAERGSFHITCHTGILVCRQR